MASSMKSVDVIQEVKILPWAKPSQQPSSETRWLAETKVRSRVNRVDRVCMEPRKLFESCGPERDKRRNGCLIFSKAQPRTVSACWNAVSAYAYRVRHGGGHRGRRPDHADQGITRELGRASSASCLHRRGSMPGPLGGSPPRYQSSLHGKARRSAGSIQHLNAETTGTRGRAGWRRNLEWALGILS